LRLPEISGISLPAFRVLRTLIQVTVDEQGQQTYRARYLLNQIGARSVEVELPAPLFQTHLPEVTVFYRGKEAAWQPVDEAGAVTSLSNIGRIVLEPGERGKPAELEIAFVLTPGRISGSHALVSTLQPPFLHGDLGLAPVRWQVVLPPTWLPLFHRESFPSGFKWGLRGWLLAPQPALDGADLERWFLGPEEAPQEKTETAANPTVVCWCAGSARLRLVHVPQEAWLFLCSLLVLLAGGGLIFLTLPRVLIWGMGIVLLGGGLAAGFFWPGLLASIFYGCQPGLLVLLPLLVLHEVFQQRYRRKVENLPSFRREPRRSSFSRPSGSKHSQKEPSTVDIPPPSPELISEKPGTDGQ
jgi:hypothetical protein